MKKLWFSLMAVIIVLSSCTVEKKLTFMVGGDTGEIAYWEEIVNEFEKAKGIKVEILRQPSDSDQRKTGIVTSLRGKLSDPDLMLMDIGWIGQIAATGWLEPLDEYGVDTKPFFESIIGLADTYQGKLIALPIYVDGGLLYYRKDLLEKYGYKNPPATWEELAKMAKKVQDGENADNSKFTGFVWQGAQYEGLICNALEYFASAGGGFFDKDGKPAIDSAANKKALQFMVDIIHTEKISPVNTYTEMKEDQAKTMFQDGNALFERNWPYAWGAHKSEGSKVIGKYAIAPLPSFKGQKSASTLGGWHAGVSKYSDMKKEAVEFLKFITSYEIQKKLSLKLGWNPGRPDVYDDADIKTKNPHFDQLKKVFMGAVPRPVVPYYPSLSQKLQESINAALAKSMDVDSALKKAQEDSQKVIKEYTER